MLSLAQLLAHGYVPWNEQDDYRTSTIAGGASPGRENGAGANATFDQPAGVSIDTVAQVLYISDRANHRVRTYDVATDTVDTFIGFAAGYADGVGEAALLNEPVGIAVDPYAGIVYVADSVNCVVRAVNIATRQSSTLAGTAGVSGFIDGQGLVAAFSQPNGLALHVRARMLFVCDPFNHAVRVIHIDTGAVRTLCGTGVEGAANGAGSVATFQLPFGVGVDDQASIVYISDRSPYVRQATLAGDPLGYSPAVVTLNHDNSTFGAAGGLAHAYGWGSLLVTDIERSTIKRIVLAELANVDADAAAAAAAAAASSNGSAAVDTAGDGFRLMAGDFPGYRNGMGIVPRFYRPEAISLDWETQSLYIADTYNNRIRLMDLTDFEEEVEERVITWDETAQTALQHNLVLIVVVIGSTIGAILLTFLCCRFCLFCPLYKKKLHEKRMHTMTFGTRC